MLLASCVLMSTTLHATTLVYSITSADSVFLYSKPGSGPAVTTTLANDVTGVRGVSFGGSADSIFAAQAGSVLNYLSDGNGGYDSPVTVQSGTNTQAMTANGASEVFVGATSLFRNTFDGSSWATTTLSGPVTLTGQNQLNLLSFALDPNGTLYAGDNNNGQIVTFTEGVGYSIFSGDVGQVNGLAFDASGSLWAASTSRDKVFKFANVNGVLSSTKEEVLTGLTDVSGIAFDPDGNLYIGGGDTGTGFINQYTFDTDGIISGPNVIATGLAGQVFALDAVPEPSSGSLLLLAGLVAIMAMRGSSRRLPDVN